MPKLCAAVEDARRQLGYPAHAPVPCCYEASRDGFSIHRMLEGRGISITVLGPASVEVSRRRRRRKTDQIDLKKLLALHVRHAYYGQEDGWRWARVPSIAAEAAMRLQHEHECLQRERMMHVNRIRSLLALQGTRCGNVRRIEPAAQRAWNGEPLPAEFQAHLVRELARLQLADKQLREVETEQHKRLTARATPTDEIAWKLYEWRGIGVQGALTLATEFFGWRDFKNVKELSALAGFYGTPCGSGEMWHDQGISKAGNHRVRRIIVQLAWMRLLWQLGSALSQWFCQRTAQGGQRARRCVIAALANKLLKALWKYSTHRIVLHGAIKKAMRGRIAAA